MTLFPYHPLDSSKNEIRLLFPTIRPKSARSKTPEIVSLYKDADFGWLDTNQSKDEIIASLDPRATIVAPDLSMEFELRTVSLDDKPVYTALSYVWGDKRNTKTITVNRTSFPVTENLECALRHIQFKDIEPAIWIDAICIDQDNIDEKSEQVPKMGRIYKNARKVHIWLGSGTAESDAVVEVLHAVWFKVCNRGGFLQGFKEKDVKQHDMTHLSDLNYGPGGCELLIQLNEVIDAIRSRTLIPSRVLENHKAFVRYACASLLACDWWYRVWIIQEYLLASSCVFQIGVRTIKPINLELLNLIISCSRNTELVNPDSIVPGSQQSSQPPMHFSSRIKFSEPPTARLGKSFRKGRRLRLFKILLLAYCSDSSRPIRCGDDRDRIFALIGLAEEEYKSLGTHIDYRKQSCEVFTDFTRCMLTSGEMDILSLCRLLDPSPSETLSEAISGPTDRPYLPSWAPDWSLDIPSPNSWFARSQNFLFSAGGRTRPRISSKSISALGGVESSCAISFTGFLVDEILTVGEFCHRDNGSDSSEPTVFLNQVKEIRDACVVSRRLGHNIYTASQYREAIWRMPPWDHEFSSPPKTLFRRATNLSKRRHNMYLQYCLTREATSKFEDLKVERPKHGLLPKLWHNVRLQWQFNLLQYHRLNCLLSFDSLIQRLTQEITPITSRSFSSARLKDFIEKQVEDMLSQSMLYWCICTSGYPTRSFITKRGYIGYGQSSAQPGDLVCIFLGARVPHILRKRGGGQDGYVLVGDAFVYGAMDGELTKEGQDYTNFEIF